LVDIKDKGLDSELESNSKKDKGKKVIDEKPSVTITTTISNEMS
jgi:hypothetical protein